MHPVLRRLAAKLDQLEKREELLGALADLEDAYDALSETEQDTAGRLIDEFRRRIGRAGQ